MGESGEILIVLMVLMAVISTGSAEVIAVTSILVYDIYQLYLKVIIFPYAIINIKQMCHITDHSKDALRGWGTTLHIIFQQPDFKR